MDAIQYIRNEHAKFKKALKEIAGMSNQDLRVKKFTALTKALVRHETMEQKVWYPVLRKNPEMKDVIKHLLSEEKHAAKAIKTLLKTSYGIMWRLRFYKLKRDVIHHAGDEEKELFPLARKYLTKKQLLALTPKLKKFEATFKKHQ